MNNSRTIVATGIGAVLGGLAGYLLFTDRGRTLRRQLEPALEDIMRELNHFRGTVQKAASVASEGWRLFNEAMGESETSTARYSNPHQTSPF